MNIIKQLRTQAEQVEVISLRNEETTISFEANRLKSSKVEETKGLAVRVVRNGRLGFSASSDEQAMNKLMANALESAAYGDEVPIRFPGAQPTSQVKTFDETIVNLSVPRLVEIGQEILDYILTIEPEAQVNVSLKRGIQNFSLWNQAGAEVVVDRSPYSIDIELTRIEGDDVLILYDVVGGTIWGETYMQMTRRLGEKLKLAQTLTTLKAGKMPVLFSPTGSLVLGIPLMEGINGKNVYKGISPLQGKVGEKLFDQKFNLADDGTLDGIYSSAPFDDEGTPHRRLSIVEAGVLKAFIYDLKTAAQSSVESTGNGSRGLFNPPQPSPTNLVIEAGETSLQEMVASVKEGLLVEDVLGLGQGNIISGAFSNPVSLAFKIENGEVVGRVKDVSIADNIYTLMQDISAISQERYWVYNAFLAPYLLVPKMNVVAKG